jgi:ABC-2 type transport system ATP-binding protein
MIDAESRQPAIEIAELLVERGGRTVLHELSLDVRRGSVTGLLGPSGSGKSTLMRAIVGVQQVTGRSVRVMGLPGGSAELRRHVSYVTQDPSVYGDLTVRENLRYFAKVLGAGRSDIAHAISAVDLTLDAERVVGRLSGGQRTRASLAVALLGRPRVLVLDEPTVGLDPVLRRDLWMLFRRLASDGATLLVSSHVMDEAERCDELVLLREDACWPRERPKTCSPRPARPEWTRRFSA